MTYPTKKLGEVIDFLKGKKMPVTEEQRLGYEPYIGIDTLKTREYKLYTPEKDGVHCSKDDVLVVWDGAYAGTVGIEVSGFAGSTVAKVVIREPELDSHYLRYFWEFNGAKIRSAAQGATIPHLSKAFINNLKITVPPPAIQKQIVERLDKIAEAQKLNDKLIQKNDELFQSLLHQELNPAGKNWEVKELGEIVEARSGFGFPMEIQGKTDGEIPFYKVSDMNLVGNEIEMVYHNNTITTKQCVDRRYKPAPKGTIIFPKIGAAVATNKKRLLVRDSLYDNNVMGFIPTAEILSEYLYFWMLRFDISLWASQSMPPSIKKSTVDKFKISLPPLETQKQIVTKLSAVQEYKNRLLVQKSKLKELFDSVLTRSFSGQ